ncbi:MAG: bifunctional 5,10-methylenetetrahydrofolate dehydrogenase/5,10-methenyltetrahydrofolate cyclohydrolase [Firmicutes bacterium]|nr:bifunctional 5,10-methylenetetrahydrofolate dehydrogenase/5,10-methenyltetrahydrofolate cyclohydrolase [Bacillota bacterium]
MTSQILKGADVAAKLNEENRQRAEALQHMGLTPTLGIIRVGEREDDLAYERSALKRCANAGVAVKQYIFPADVPEVEFLSKLRRIARDRSIHGCLIFRPLPKHIDDAKVCAILPLEKDVDGITPAAMSALYAGTGGGFAPCTAQACIEMLDHYQIPFAGKRVVVIGRSLVVGKPLAMLLMARDATVMVCHSKTPDTAAICRNADIVISAAGRAKMVGMRYMIPRHTVLDVGINVSEDGQLVGDVDFDAASQVVHAVSPVPGGVGTVTCSVLVRHVIEAAERRAAKLLIKK